MQLMNCVRVVTTTKQERKAAGVLISHVFQEMFAEVKTNARRHPLFYDE